MKLALVFSFMLALAFSSCGKHPCYSEALRQQYKSVGCTQDCPGVTGCDGKFYCNECMALTQGIRVK